MSAMTRHVARGLAILLATAGCLAFQSAAPAAACACGAFAPTLDQRVDMAEEVAMVKFSDGQETISMRLTVDSVTRETGLIFPTPAPATVALGDNAPFEAVRTQTAPIYITEYDWWGSSITLFAGAAPPDGSAGAPQVLSVTDLGPFQATVLAADDAAGLTAWLDANGYGLPESVTALLGDYVDRGWYFTALKLVSEEDLTGALDPVVFTFDADEPVYPLLLSQAATQQQNVFLYVFADHRQDALWEGTTVDAMEVTWAGWVTEESLLEWGAYLTVLEGNYWDPATSVQGDVALVQSADDSQQFEYIYQTKVVWIGILPAGWAIILLSLGPVAALIAVLIGKARTRAWAKAHPAEAAARPARKGQTAGAPPA
jgi:hypothetical protein